jgi:hypothetical protein
MAEMPRAIDLFGDADSAKSAAVRMDDYQAALTKSFSAPTSSNLGATPTVDPVAALESLVANKSIAPDALASVTNALATQRQVQADIAKDISLTSPLSSSFAAFDLEAPAKLLTPRPTPLRNKIARKKGVGTSHRVKRILGYTGTGTGGIGNIFPGVTETTTTTFGSIAYERGPKISYAADDLILPYNTYSLSDSVSFDANFSGLGFQDLRQLSSTSTLYATMLMEERMLLMARGTGSGYSGALAAPTVTVAAANATGSQVGLAASTQFFVYVTADAGAFGESVVSAVQSATTSSGSQVITITVGAVTGALGYKVYVGTTTGATNAKYVGRFTGTVATLQGATSTNTTNNNLVYSTSGAVAPSADTSAYATGYDGIIPTLLGSAGGFNNNINAQFSTSNPGSEYQTVFYNLYNNVKADPDEILINGSDRKQLSDAIKNGSTANYRLNLSQDETGNYVGGATIGALHNEVTGKLVDITVHPWLPQGVSPVMSYTLPIPDSEVSDCWAVYNVQDYMGVQWPVTQFSYDFSTYFRGTFMAQAPAWSGIVSGIASA